MKIRFGLILLLLGVPMTAHGHTEIFFPKLFSKAELPNTGFALLNPDPTPATVYLYLVGPDGLGPDRPAVSSRILTIPPGGQLAILGSELFPNPVSGGWVYVINDTEGMQAFWLNYNAGPTSLDGAEASQYETIGPDQIIPLVAGQTELNVINPGGFPVPVTVDLFGSTGQLAPSVIRQLPIAGAFQTDVSAMFPFVDMTQTRYIRIHTNGGAIASSAVIRNFLVPTDSAVINGANVSTRTETVFPHVVSGAFTGANYTTVIGVTNMSTASQTVVITFNLDEGGSTTVSRTISGRGALRETAQSLFGLPTDFQSGWVRVSGTAGITGFAAYADDVAGGIAVVPAGSPQTNLFFSQIADGPPQWQTGLALLNPGAAPANVEVYAMNPSGALIGGAMDVSTARFTLDPGKEIANVIHEWIPQTRGVNGGFVYVRSTNGVPLYGVEIFYTEDLKVLSNVSPGKLVSGVRYTPPSQ